LLYADGFTIKGVQKLLREQGVRYVAALGRNESSLISQLSQKSSPSLTQTEGGEAPLHARAALAAVAAAHPDAVQADTTIEPTELDEAVRGRLADILVELEGLKERLHRLPWRLAAE
jgi:hypothetical protein